jgi:hypothetical protein
MSLQFPSARSTKRSESCRSPSAPGSSGSEPGPSSPGRRGTSLRGARLTGVAARGALAAIAACAGLAAHTPSVAAHWQTAEDVVEELRAPAYREQFDVTRVDRHPDLERLLVIRVGPGWRRVAAATRRKAAASWLSRWRHAVPQGIVAVLDASSDRSLVNFDSDGHAALTD